MRLLSLILKHRKPLQLIGFEVLYQKDPDFMKHKATLWNKFMPLSYSWWISDLEILDDRYEKYWPVLLRR